MRVIFPTGMGEPQPLRVHPNLSVTVPQDSRTWQNIPIVKTRSAQFPEST